MCLFPSPLSPSASPDPVISGPSDPVAEGVNVVLTCVSPNNKPIEWSRQDNMPISRPVFVFDNTLLLTSTLTIMDIKYANRGVYVCRVGQGMGTFDLRVIETTGNDDMVMLIMMSL